MKKYIKIMLVLATASMCLTACGKKDTGIIVNVGDTNNDSSQNEQVVGDSNTEVLDNSIGSSVKHDNTVSEVELNKVTNLVGTWVTDTGTIYEFKEDNTFTGYLVETSENIHGTYDTDSKDYLNLIISREVEIVKEPTEGETVITPEAGTEATEGTIVEEVIPLPPEFEIVEEPHKYQITEIVDYSDNSGTKLTLVENSVETVLNRSASIPSNSSDYKKTENTVSEPKSLTPEEVEAANQAALELGIDPETGLPLPEEPVEELTDENGEVITVQ